MEMSDEAREKDRIPPEEGIVHPAEEMDRVNDSAPTEGATAENHDVDKPLDKRPTDGPM
ncbi:MAG TPA: hypothetical protein VM253_07245 [Candidatus Limnocylindrales bacterium]|jgi:hypothetical protein|nr:hypothetical protein [Candidatus Limnocylindrales bacterium]